MKTKRSLNRSSITGSQQSVGPTLPPVPPPNNDAADCAQAISVAIGQGLPGDFFADLVHGNDPELIRTAARFTLDECMKWFRESPQAAAILDATPGFDVFGRAFHARAQQYYPPTPKVTL